MPARGEGDWTETFRGVRHRFHVDADLGAGAVTLATARLDPGAVVPPHTHPVEDAMVVLEGRGELVVDGNVHTLRPGGGYLAPANVVHHVRNTGDEDLVIVFTWPAVDVARRPAKDA